MLMAQATCEGEGHHEEKEGNSDAKQGPDGDGPILGVDSESASDSGSDGEWTPPFADAFEEDTGAFPFGTYSKIASHAESPVGVIQAAIKLLQVFEGDVFVDVGCGKGAALLHAANLLNSGTRCIGIDLCGGEIDCARKKLRGEGLQVQDRVEFLQLDALEFLNSPQSFVHVGTGKKMCLYFYQIPALFALRQMERAIKKFLSQYPQSRIVTWMYHIPFLCPQAEDVKYQLRLYTAQEQQPHY